MKSLMLVLLAALLLGCASPAQRGGSDGVYTAAWVYGSPMGSLRFDRELYLSNADYRARFDEGIHARFFFTFRDVSAEVRQLLRLDELTAEAEARARDAQATRP